MNNEPAFSAQSFHVAFQSVCGCFFSLSGSPDVFSVQLASSETRMSRRRESSPAALDAVRAWFFDTVQDFSRRAFEQHRDGGGPQDIAPAEFFSAELGLELSAAPLAGHSDCVRLKVTLLSDDRDSLIYCHVGASLDLPFVEIVEEVISALAVD